jgi:hypothetical protein
MITGQELLQIHSKVVNENKVKSKVFLIKNNQIIKQIKHLIFKIQKNKVNNNKGKNY